MAEIKIYRFGARWHWKCERGPGGAHEGGMKRSQSEAYAAAEGHYNQEHRASDEANHARYMDWAVDQCLSGGEG